MLCCALVLAAPAPPEPPAITEEAAAIMQRTTDLVVRDTRAWQRDHGDQTIPWDEAEGHLAIVIDDVGRELHLFEQLLALRHPLTFSVLPGSIYALGVQLRLRGDARRPREIMLHLPMEPGDPGMMVAGAEADEAFLLRADSPAARRAKLEAAVTQQIEEERVLLLQKKRKEQVAKAPPGRSTKDPQVLDLIGHHGLCCCFAQYWFATSGEAR